MTPPSSSSSRPRLDDLGVASGAFARGAANAITDVPGVRVGHATLHGDGLHTGVTAIVSDALTAERRSLPRTSPSATATASSSASRSCASSALWRRPSC
ncbi:P1 family peptidase [Microbacterium maritypicum]|uniref:P1 family peptidase n=1 Tax=Microbacterium maritypicum TaxID=33918 RepID=UPI0022DFCEA9|nr:P1 family peptidase [Microbacterium liquefaciens]